MIIQGIKCEWELVIGLEIHAQLSSNSKLFSSASTGFGEENNEQVSFIDSAMPGMLPVTNERCVELAVRAGLALDAKINEFSMFDRKNYFCQDFFYKFFESFLYWQIIKLFTPPFIQMFHPKSHHL